MKKITLALFVLFALTACSEAADAGTGSGFVGGDGSIVVVSPEQRVLAPDLRGTSLDGDQIEISDYLGDIVVINVWASWCAPCRAEAPELEAAWNDVRGDGVQFLGLNTRDSELSAQRFVETMALTFPSIRDNDGRLQLLFADSLPPQAIPSTLVIDREGKVAARMLGKVSSATLRGVIDEVNASG